MELLSFVAHKTGVATVRVDVADVGAVCASAPSTDEDGGGKCPGYTEGVAPVPGCVVAEVSAGGVSPVSDLGPDQRPGCV